MFIAQEFAHEGTEFTALYEHISPDTPPGRERQSDGESVRVSGRRERERERERER
eukprot:COSAG03_NODE_20174_length_323_cov_0.919643_1_plen_54_part_01